MMRFDAVVFDMDGVIFDSERVLTDIWGEVGAERGYPDMAEAILTCIGITAESSKKILTERYGADFDYEGMSRTAYSRFLTEYADRMPVKPYVREFLAHIKAEGKGIALATSTAENIARQELTAAGLINFFDVIVCGNMVSRSKPAPDIFLLACERLGVKPENAYGMEDSHNGIRALHAAGLHGVMIPDMLPVTEEMRDLAEHIVPTLREADELLFG